MTKDLYSGRMEPPGLISKNCAGQDGAPGHDGKARARRTRVWR